MKDNTEKKRGENTYRMYKKSRCYQPERITPIPSIQNLHERRRRILDKKKIPPIYGYISSNQILNRHSWNSLLQTISEFFNRSTWRYITWK